MIPTDDKQFAEYLKNIMSGNKDALRHPYYDETVEHSKAMSVHVSGTSPKELLEKQRPHEPDDVKQYRLDSYKPVTKSKSKKVISIINRIYNDRMFRIEIDEKPNNQISDEETLDKYLFSKFPFHRDLMNFIKEVYTKRPGHRGPCRR